MMRKEASRARTTKATVSRVRTRAQAGTREGINPSCTMRAVIQRVLSASVEVNGSIVSSIDRGLVCLIGLGKGEENAVEATDYIAKKILNGRYFENEETGKP